MSPETPSEPNQITHDVYVEASVMCLDIGANLLAGAVFSLFL